jgi:50S ribosomal protein L16 3-hydroxylase
LLHPPGGKEQLSNPISLQPQPPSLKIRTLGKNTHSHIGEKMSSKAAFHPIAAVRFQTHLGVGIVQGPLSPNVLAPFWGRDPLLIRSGFDADNLLETDTWPSWDTITQISFEEDADSRIIKHVPGDFTSFTLDVGPFVPEEFDALHDICWTLVVNDVDRFHPPLAEWMDQTFSFIPRWRRDDGQVSLATKTGGIGPHCDNYDVFLIQASGEREWIIGKDKITVKEEMESLIEGIDVRILKDWNDRESTRLVLKPGDVLYLPPRVAHCGIALADGSMTLSVGCRTPSASDIISRLAERLTGSVSPTVVRRFEDVDLLLQSGRQTGEITPDIKNQMKKLVSDALHTFMEDENQWDSLVGEILTESTRLRYAYPLPLADADPDWIAELGVWGDPKQAVAMVLGGKGAFFRAEGVSFAYSKDESAMRLFANGESFEILSNSPLTEAAVIAIINESELTANTLGDDEFTVGLLEQLVAKGLLYGSA